MNVQCSENIQQYTFSHNFQNRMFVTCLLQLTCFIYFRKNMQRNKQVAMGRKKFNMDPKKVSEHN